MKHGIVLENLDKSVSPKTDFYKYACGGWQQAHPLQGEFARFGTFSLIREETKKQVRSLIEELGENPDSKVHGTVAQKVHDLYEMGMDMPRRDAEGANPLVPMIKRVEATDRKNLADTIAWMFLGISSPFFSIGVGPDPVDSNMNILHVGETGLGLGDRDYYLEDNDNNRRIMEAYHRYVVRLMTLCGYSTEDAERIWNSLIKIEKEIALHKKTREERRDPELRYNPTDANGLKKDFPGIEWERIFKGMAIEPNGKINVSAPKFLSFMSEYLPSLTEREIRDYLLFEAIASSTGVLGDDFYDADFELYDKTMSGIEEKRPLWKRAMVIPNSLLAEAIGQLYVEKYFPKENKDYMKELVENLRKSLASHIKALPWMSESTKANALDKLAAMHAKIGYPDKWKDYSEIEIDPQKSYLENVLAASKWFVNDNLKKLGTPVDRNEWFMAPHTVNAYYSPSQNEICFPAAILQPPYFDITADDAMNYGAIGSVIGHEMTHGFDDQGRHFDKNGNLSNWWTEEDAEKFRKLTDVLVRQFDAIEVAPGVHANGRFTLGENIADQGGLRVALTAYRESSSPQEKEEIDGFSSLQRFYLANAALWANNIRPEEILEATKTDPHSLPEYRVNATVKNIPEFYEAFSIKENDAMYLDPADRVIIW